MTAASTVSPDFWNRIAQSYAKKPVPDEVAYHATLDRTRSYLTPTSRVLEVGCGTGTTALHLAPHLGALLATDASPQMIAIAREKARAAGASHVEFRTATLDDEALTPSSYDVVAAFNLIHLYQDIPSALRRASQLLAPGGLFISKTPCVGDSSSLLRVAIPVARFFGKAPFVNFVTKAGLEQAILDAGLDIVERGLYPAKSHSLFIVARKN
jgi:ubiquinone/menaquinone biosynthesis C-methylase UbiE